MARLTKTDWLKKGLQVLSQKGYNHLRLEYLCDQLSVTRGSFYHHFEDINDYVDKLMEYWEANSIQIMDGVAATGGKPSERLNLLQERVFDISARLEVVVRAWATFNKTVLKYIRRIDRRRIDFMTALYLEDGLSEESAETTAKIEYMAYIGAQNLAFMDNKRDSMAIYAAMERVLLKFKKKNVLMPKREEKA